MSESIIFRGTFIRYFDVRQGKEGGDVFCRIHLSSTWNEQVRDNMNWEVIPDSITECKLTGELLASHMILTPGDKQLANDELQIDISSVEDFCLVALKDEGELRGRELRFVIRTPKEVEGFLGQYIRKVGRHEGALKISYVKQEAMNFEASAGSDAETKANLARAAHGPITDDQKRAMFGEADGPCTSCNNEIPFEDEDHTTHVTGQPCARSAGSTLAAAATAGGTHQKRRGRSKPAPAEPAGDPESDGIQVEEEPIIN
jgi:hypothetical protein